MPFKSITAPRRVTDLGAEVRSAAVLATPSGDPARALVLGRLRRLLGPFLGTAER